MYLWMKWLHIVAIISWMAGILYLYRLFIYHSERGKTDQTIHQLLSLMEFRLYKYITIPAMIIAAIAGTLMISLSPELLQSGWLWAKLVFVGGLIASTLKAGSIQRHAAENPQTLPSGKYLRIANEIPTLLMLFIVGFVVFKAF